MTQVFEPGTALEEQIREAAIDDLKRGKVPTPDWFVHPELQGLAQDAAMGTTQTVGTITMYHTMTGQPSEVLEYMVAKKLGHKRPDGKSWWTLNKDSAPAWVRGTIKCQLHPEHEDREWLDSIGLQGRTCSPLRGRHKQNMDSDFALERHMEVKHPREWATIQREHARVEQQEERDFQRALMTQLAGNAPAKKAG